MKNIINSLFLLSFSLSLCAAQVHIAAMEDLQAIIQQGNFSVDSLKRHEGYNALMPGSFAVAKSTTPVPNYPDGIYLLVITPLNKSPYQKPVYQLDTLEFLKNKKAFLHLKIIGRPGHAEFRLPAMDTLVESTDIDGCQFLLGVTTSAGLPNAYYFMSGKQTFSKPVYFETRRRDRVFATNPQSFNGRDLGRPIRPIPLAYQDPHKQFFFNHTRGLSQIPESKAALTSAHIIDTDTHNRPARKHQIKQILEYIIAKEKGAHYMTFAAATGSGKTNTMLRLAELIRPKKVLIVTPRENLITQIMEESRVHYPHLTISGSNESNSTVLAFLQANTANNDITVTSLQGFQQPSVYKNDELLSKIDIVVFDEAHNLFSPKRSEVINHLKSFNNKNIELLFFTATPTRLIPHNESNLSSVYELSNEDGQEYHITPFSLFDAIDAKANAPFQIINVVNLPPLKEALKVVDGEYNETQLNKLLADSNEHHSVAFDLYQKYFGEFAMASCVGIAHAEKLAAYFNSRFEYPTRTDHAHVFEALKADYEKNVRMHFSQATITQKDKRSPEEKIRAFLAKYPFIFADAVHSGNEAYPLSDHDANDKLLRNRLGGSLFLAGATKLMEGFDNPRIKVLFNLRPSRQSNIRLVQTIGRALRIDSKNPERIAKIFEFVYDKKQLLTSSARVLGVMSYGIAPGHEIRISMDEHVPGTASYKLSYHALSEITPKQSKKRRLSGEGDDEPFTKRTKTSLPRSSIESQLQKLVKELKHKLKILPHFGDGTMIPDDEDMDVDTASSSAAPAKKTNSRADEFSSFVQSESTHGDDMAAIRVLLQEAQSLFEIAKQFFAQGDRDIDLPALAARILHFENQLAENDAPPALSSTSTTTTHVNTKLNDDDSKEVEIIRSESLGTYTRPGHLEPFRVEEQFNRPFNDYLETHSANPTSPAILNIDIYEMYKDFYKYKYNDCRGHKSVAPNGKLWENFKLQLTRYFLSSCHVNRIKISVISTGDFLQRLHTDYKGVYYSVPETSLEVQFDAYVAEVKSLLTELGFQKIIKQPAVADNRPIPLQGLPFGAVHAAGVLGDAMDASRAIAAGDIKRGAELYYRALRNNPYLPEWVYNEAAQAHFNIKDYTTAANLYETIFQSNPNCSVAIYKNAAMVHKILKNWRRSAELFEICLKIDPNCFSEIYFDAVRTNYNLRNWQRTGELNELCLQNYPIQSKKNYYFIVHVYVLLGRWSQAIKHGVAALAAGYKWVLFDLGVAYLQVGRHEEGIALIKEFVDESYPVENTHIILNGRPMEILEEAFKHESDSKYLHWLEQQKEIIRSMH